MSNTHPLDSLFTVRDWLRYAVSRFSAAGLSYGHGTSTALDEAAFLILHTLHLPIDDLAPWLDARLIGKERAAVLDIIEQRIATRKPAPYLTGVAYIRGHRFRVDERVIVPRSYIGELLFGDLFGGDGFALVSDPSAIETVLDLCTGSGCLAILAAHVFRNATIDAVDLSREALEVAVLNVAESGLGDRISLHHGDLFAPVRRRRYDLIITNPPYVDAETMAALPPEFRAEPYMALAGGRDGLDLVRRILNEAGEHLTPHGGIICEIGTDREILDAEYPDLDFLWLDSAESSGEVFWLRKDQLDRLA